MLCCHAARCLTRQSFFSDITKKHTAKFGILKTLAYIYIRNQNNHTRYRRYKSQMLTKRKGLAVTAGLSVS